MGRIREPQPWEAAPAACCGQGPGRDGRCCPSPAPALGFRSLPQSVQLLCPVRLTPAPPPLPLQVEGFRTTVAQRLVRMLQICAGHVPGVSALNLLSLLRSSENPVLEDL